jgi:hypothetical protein
MGVTAGVNGDLWLSTSPSVPLLPVKDAVSNSSTASGSSLTWSHTVGVASNMALVVAVAVGSSDTVSGVTYAGSSMTQLSSKNQGTETLYLFYKVAPATGANNVVATFSGTAAGIGLGVSYSNVNQTTPFGTATSSSGTSGSSSNTVTSTTTSQLIVDINFANGSSSTAGASQTVETSNTAVAPFYFSDIAATGASMPLSWTNAGAPTIWIEMSAPLNPNPEACTDSGDHQNYYTSVHQAWDPTKPITVQNSPDGTTWSTVAASNYTVWWPVGAIVFNSVQTNTHVRILAGNVFTLSALDGAHKWSAQFKAMTKDSTAFQASGGWGSNTATVKQATFSADCYRDDARVLQEMITDPMTATNISKGLVLCQLWWDETNGKRWQMYCLPTEVDQTIVATDINKQTVKFINVGPAYIVYSNTFSTTNVKQL